MSGTCTPSQSSAALTVNEAASYLRISRTTVWRLLKNKKVARVRIGGRTLIRRVDIDNFLEQSVEAA